MLVLGKLFRPSLMLVAQDKDYPRVEHICVSSK